MRILVTGASGFIGTNLCYYLKDKGHEVFPVCTHTNVLSDTFGSNSVFCNLLGFDTNILKKMDGIFHLAANNDTISTQNSEMLRTNFYESKKLLGYALKYDHKFFVYASSTAVYGRTTAPLTEDSKTKPLNIYAKSKLKFDKFMLKTNPKILWAGLRLCNIYGPYEGQKSRRMSYLGQMLHNMLHQKEVKLFESGHQKRDWCFVEDVCQAFYKAKDSYESGIFNIGTGQSVAFIDLFKLLADKTGYEKLPVWIKNNHSKQYQDYVEVDYTKATQYMGYAPNYDITNGIDAYLKFEKNNLVA